MAEETYSSWRDYLSIRPGDVTCIGIYVSSRLLEVIESDPRTAWKIARERVRECAFETNYTGSFGNTTGKWETTANRAVYSCGGFRALPMIADRASLHLNDGRLP